MPPFATYALLAACAVALASGIWLGGRSAERRWPRLARWSLAITIGAVVAAYLVVRPGKGDDPDAALREAAADGKPLFVDVYSNF
jgi:hypothetical protein